MARIYLSHAYRDLPVASKFLGWLSENAISRAISSTIQSQHDDDAIGSEQRAVKTVRDSDLVILLCSNAWVLCRQCFAEYVTAQSSEKLIVAVLVEELSDKLPISDEIPRFTLGKDGRDLVKLVGLLRASERKGPADFEWSLQRPAYPGLRAFRPEEAGVFFGRDGDVRRIVERVSAALIKQEPHLVTLSGPAGSGISSLMLAGVLPGIEKNQANVIALPAMRPRLRPLDAFAIALAGALDRPNQWREWVDELTDADADGLMAFLEARIADLREHRDAPDADILLPVDQFEELYHVSGAAQAQIFQALLAAVMAEDLPIFVIAALASGDAKTFLSSPLSAFRFEALTVKPIPTSRYGEIVRGPAERAGLKVKDGLVRTVERHAALASGDALARVAYVLRRIYDEDRAKGRLTESSYLRHGDADTGQSPLDAAVARAAESALERAEAHIEERRAARQALARSLVRWTARAQPVKRPASVEAFPRQALDVLEQLTAAGLLAKVRIGDEHLVEFTSQALLRIWPWLEQALHAERSGPEIIASGCTELARYDPPPVAAVTFRQRVRRAARNAMTGLLCIGAGLTVASARLAGPEQDGPPRPAVLAHGSKLPADIAERGVLPQAPTPVALAMTPTAWRDRPAQTLRISPKAEAKPAPDERPDLAPSPVALSTTPSLWGRAQPTEPVPPKAPAPSAAAIAPLQTLLALVQRPGPDRGRPERLLLAVEALLHPEAWTLSSRRKRQLERAILQDIHALSEPVAFRTHRDTAFSAALAPDGETVVTASADGTARLWALRTRAELRTLAGHRGYVHGATFGPDGARVATASGDGTARVWRIDGEASPLALRGHGGAVHRAAFDPAGTRIVTASADGTARIWDAATGSRLRTLAGHGGAVWSAAFSADGRRIATAAKDNTARIWNAATGAPLVTLEGHRSDVMSAAFSPDGARIATASRDGTVRLWDAGTGREIAVLRGHTDTVIGAQFGAGAGLLVSASFDGTVKVWDLAAGHARATFRFDGQRVRSARLAPGGRSILILTGDGTLHVRPLFASNGDLVAGALKAAGGCLDAAERRALGLPADLPAWCGRLAAHDAGSGNLTR